jgi:hypothetical protein
VRKLTPLCAAGPLGLLPSNLDVMPPGGSDKSQAVVRDCPAQRALCRVT